MNQNDTNKEANALSDEFLGQVSGGKAVSGETAKKEFLDAIKNDPNGGWNFWNAHDIPDPHSKSNPFNQ